jgi:thiol-disulfide isomerase/thioredoxin
MKDSPIPALSPRPAPQPAPAKAGSLRFAVRAGVPVMAAIRAMAVIRAMAFIRAIALIRAIAAVAAIAVGAAVAASPAAAQRVPADNVLRDFQRIGDYVLVINGKPVPAEIYQSQRAAALLVISSSFPSPVLLSPGLGAAQTVNLMKVEKKPDGSIDLLSDAVLAPQGAIDLQDEEVHFKADGISAALVPTPPLLGLRRLDEVVAHNPEYLPRAASYAPNSQAVAALKREKRPVVVRIFYGSWCPHCREMVPHAIKLEQLLRGASIHFQYFGLPQRFGTDPPAVQNKIKAVPTGIVYVNGKEIGRITNTAWTVPENTLVAILAGKAPPPDNG